MNLEKVFRYRNWSLRELAEGSNPPFVQIRDKSLCKWIFFSTQLSGAAVQEAGKVPVYSGIEPTTPFLSAWYRCASVCCLTRSI